MARTSSGRSRAADPETGSSNIAVPLAEPGFGGHRQNKSHAGEKAADVREPSYVAAGCLRVADRSDAAEELYHEPIQQEERGGNIDGGDENKNWHQRDNA